jgi:hypothetical protein
MAYCKVTLLSYKLYAKFDKYDALPAFLLYCLENPKNYV